MESTGSIRFSFLIDGKRFVWERQLSIPELLKTPEEYGDTLRSAWLLARDDAAEAQNAEPTHPADKR